MSRAAIMLLEGLTEEVLYLSLLKRLYETEDAGIDNLPKSLREYLEPLGIGRRIKSLIIKPSLTYVIVIDCGGYEQIKSMLKFLLRRSELKDVIKDLKLYFIIFADKDKKPLESITGLLHSLRFKVTREGLRLTINVQEGYIDIYVVEQGRSGEGATAEIEDNLREILELNYPDIKNVIKTIEKLKGPLNDKQKLLIYLSILNNGISFRST